MLFFLMLKIVYCFFGDKSNRLPICFENIVERFQSIFISWFLIIGIKIMIIFEKINLFSLSHSFKL